jgi:uncharacterized protein Yka (UPF0111/DUF47 family)
MFEHLRTIDAELFEQLGLVCANLVRSARLLEQMLAGGPDGEARLAHEIHDLDRDAHDLALAVDTRAFKAFVMRVDRMDVHHIAVALDAVVDAVEKAASHAAALHASGAPEALRSLAAGLTRMTEALEAAVPHVGRDPALVVARVTEIRQIAKQGDALFDRGVEELFAGAPDALDVLRRKDVYEKLSWALRECARMADALEHVAHSGR